MTGGRAKRRRKQEWRKTYAHRIRSLSYKNCPNCGEPGPHFVPPSGGGRFPGFFICNPKETTP